ncbi:MAG: division/cell wall cluster transcriptional repressor MraZ [Gammaproteobacteria bacterium]|jgi:MraZ protein|nr:division/cell wall cluster transcriptional repressor MraZ [Gammaproteobacteria bacterium]
MFRGSFSLTLDDKGRLALPTRYRDSLFADAEGAMVCTIHTKDPCLLLYPLPEWEDVAEQLQRLSNQNPQELRFKRLLIGHASDCDMDKSGRILLPAPLRSHASLTKNIRLVGQLNKFEIWDEETWNKRVAEDMAIERDMSVDAEISERLQDFVL